MDGDDKVVPINGDTFHVPGVQQDVIDTLKNLLEKAEMGEIVGIIAGVIMANYKTGIFSAKGSATYASLVAAASICQFDLCNTWDIE